ncbi:hypothetical protein [Rhizobium halophytocola]|uniref:Lipoprotein n=1 Tax=Rhizobium halophytocola TaxID=735519 RepID=A0ABS4DYG4_9HYPH|nr:hypothetical protein [Rhizobium halophytocola]MBP1850732.1 hypothetical protein [Rhizobium halophytocola]
MRQSRRGSGQRAFRSLAVALAGIGALLAGCQRESEDGPLSVAGRLFEFNYRNATAAYILTLNRDRDLPEGSVVETAYEDPAGGKPIVTATKIYPFWEKIALQSPPVHCIVKDRPYKVTVTLKNADGREVQTLRTEIISNIDQTVLPEKPLTVGPGYTPNPQVFHADGTPDFAPEKGCPTV